MNWPPERYWRLVDEGAELGVVEWRLIGGGDSLCRPNVTIGLIERIKREKMYGYICTNGSLFTDDSIRLAVSSEWDHVKFQLRVARSGDARFSLRCERFFRENYAKPSIVFHLQNQAEETETLHRDRVGARQ